jgi:hypothetical protein
MPGDEIGSSYPTLRFNGLEDVSGYNNPLRNAVGHYQMLMNKQSGQDNRPPSSTRH